MEVISASSKTPRNSLLTTALVIAGPQYSAVRRNACFRAGGGGCTAHTVTQFGPDHGWFRSPPAWSPPRISPVSEQLVNIRARSRASGRQALGALPDFARHKHDPRAQTWYFP